MAIEVGAAYVSILPSTKGFTRRVASELRPEMAKAGAESGREFGKKMSDGAASADVGGSIGARMKTAGASAGSKFTAGMATVLKASAAGLGLSLAAPLVKGFNRLSAIDQAKAKLRGLGHEAAAVEQVMKDANAAVKGTAFGLDEAATTAASAMAAGVKEGADLERYLRSVADAATIAGTDMSTMGSVFGKVAASGKAQMDVIGQLSDAGVPALQFLAKEMGVTAAEASKMASEGKVDFETFRRAMESGLGGAAQSSGETAVGAFKNMNAAIGRVGANLLSGVFPFFAKTFTGIQNLLVPVEAAAKTAGAALGVMLTEVAGGFRAFGAAWTQANGDITSADFAGVMERIAGGLRGIYDLVVRGDFSEAFANIFHVEEDAAIVGLILDVRQGLIEVASWAGERIPGALAVLGGVISSVFQGVAGWVQSNASALLGLAKVIGVILALWGTYRVVTAAVVAVQTAVWASTVILTTVQTALAAKLTLTTARTIAQAAAQNLLNRAMKANPIGLVITLVLALAAGIAYLWRTNEGFRDTVIAVWSAVSSAVTGAWAAMSGAARAAWDSITGVVAGIGSAMSSAGTTVQSYAASVSSWFGSVVQAARGFAAGVGAAIGGMAASVGAWFSGIVAAVQQFGSGLASAVSGVVRPALAAVGTAFAWLRDSVVVPVLSAITTAITTAVRAWQSVFGWIGQVIYAVLAISFFYFRDGVVVPVMQAVTSAVSAAGTAITAAFNAVAVFVRGTFAAAWTWLRDSVITPVTAAVTSTVRAAQTAITAALSAVAVFVRGVFAAAWTWLLTSVIRPVWAGVTTVIAAARATITATLNALISFVRGVFTAAWRWLLTSVIQPTWAAITSTIRASSAAVTATFNALISFIRGALTAAWNYLRDLVSRIMGAVGSTIRAGWERTIRPVFDQITRGVRALPGVFDAAKRGIATAWDGVRRAALKPVEFVVQTVLNQGLVKGINTLGKPFGVSVPYIPWTVKLATGGSVPGWSPNDKADNIPAWLTADEFVTRRWAARRMKRRHPGVLEHINEHGDLPGYARGGTVMDSARPGPGMGGRTSPIIGARPKDTGLWRKLSAWVKANIPGARITSAYRPTMTATGKISNHARGQAVDIAGGPGLMSIFNAIKKAFPNSLELIYSGAGGAQIYRGRPHMYTGVTRANHWDHVHWSMGAFNGPDDTGGWFNLNPFEAVGNAASKLLDGVKGKFGDNFVTQLAVAMPKKLIGGVGDWFAKKAGEMFAVDSAAPGGSVGGGVTQWTSTVQKALGLLGQPLSLTQTVLRRMNQESSGNARAVNNWDVNAKRGTPSKGLMQVIDPTFRAHAMPGYNTNIWDPLSNILASMRYAMSRYGSLSAAYNRKGGYAAGGWVKPTLYDTGGILPPGVHLVQNATGKPETIRTFEQERALQRGDTWNITINGVDANNAEQVAARIGQAVRRERARVTR